VRLGILRRTPKKKTKNTQGSTIFGPVEAVLFARGVEARGKKVWRMAEGKGDKEKAQDGSSRKGAILRGEKILNAII